MSRLASKASAILGGIAIAAMLPGVASADDRGDRTLDCVRGEICFSENTGGQGGLRHFYYSGPLHKYAGNFHNGHVFWHAASAIWNRDTEEHVCVRESGDWTNDTFKFLRTDTQYVSFPYDLNDENAEHWRNGQAGKGTC